MTSTRPDTPAIVEDRVDIVQVSPPATTNFSWSAAIAGAFAATAISFIIISLGSGIGLAIASPYGSGPSATTLTLMGAVWLVMAQALGFACGGYLAARLRPRVADDVRDEATFRDAAHGLVVWALGVALVALMVIVAARSPLNAVIGAASANPQEAREGLTGYYVDMLFRPARAQPGTQATPAPASPAGSAAADPMRTEASRIVGRSIAQRELSADDRAYLAQLVAQRTGMAQDQANQRVSEVESAVKQAADKAAKAGAFLSFWTFMSLLFGGAAAALGGMLGGESRVSERAWSPAVQPR